MSKYIELNEAKQATVLPPALEESDVYLDTLSFMTQNETMCVAFHVEVKGTERFVKAVIWSCESSLMNIKCRLLMKKHVKLVFLPSSFLYFLSFFFPVLKFTLKTLGQADLYCLALD